MIYLLTFLMLSYATVNCMNQDFQKNETAIGAVAATVPNAPQAPNRLPIQTKIMYAAVDLVSKTARPLEQFIPLLELQTLIAQYASSWVPYRVVHTYGELSYLDPAHIYFSESEDSLITIERETKNYENNYFHTKVNIKTKQVLHKQPVELRHYSKLSFYGNFLVHFPPWRQNSHVSVTSVDGKTSRQWYQDPLYEQSLSSCSSEKTPLVAYGTYGEIRTCNIETGKLSKINMSGFFTDEMAISPDGKFLAANLRKRAGNTEKPYIAIFDSETSKLLVKITKEQISAEKVKLLFLPDSKTLIICDKTNVPFQGKIYFVNRETQKIKIFEPKHQFQICSMSCSPDGKLFATTSKSETAIWAHNSSESIELVQSIQHNTMSLKMLYHPAQIAFSPSGTYIAIGQTNYPESGIVTIWKNNANSILMGIDDEHEQNLFDQTMPIGERVKERIMVHKSGTK